MEKELYLYSPIYDFIAERLIASMEENADDDITIRVNTPGGNVFAGWGIIAKMQERKGKTNIKLDGAAMSMGAILLAYADNVEALDVSTVMLHRASMYVSTPEDQAFLDSINKNLRAKLEAKIDVKALEELKGISIKNLFEDEKRIDLFLTAKEAKKIGLINKINAVNPKELTAFNERMFSVAAIHETEPIKKITMTLEKIKAEHPAVYAEIVAVGVAQEKDRVEACMAFIEIDAVGVKAAIESGKPLTQKQMAEFSLKALNGETLKKVEAGAAEPIKTAEPAKEKTEKETALSAFEAEAKAILSVK